VAVAPPAIYAPHKASESNVRDDELALWIGFAPQHRHDVVNFHIATMSPFLFHLVTAKELRALDYNS